jgi:hypothetical protein
MDLLFPSNPRESLLICGVKEGHFSTFTIESQRKPAGFPVKSGNC